MLIDQSIRHFGTLLHLLDIMGLDIMGIKHSGTNPVKVGGSLDQRLATKVQVKSTSSCFSSDML